MTAILASIATNAGRGSQFARAIAGTIGFPLVCFLVFVPLFYIAWFGAAARLPAALAALTLSAALVVLEFMGLTIPIFGNLPVALFFAVFGLLLLIMFVLTGADPESAENPFSDGQLPPQILPPRELPQ